jgi:hypothetical protein
LPDPPVAHIAGLREKARFNVDRIEKVEREFFASYLERALYTTVPARRTGGKNDEVAPLSLADYEAASAESPLLHSGFKGWAGPG